MQMSKHMDATDRVPVRTVVVVHVDIAAVEVEVVGSREKQPLKFLFYRRAISDPERN